MARISTYVDVMCIFPGVQQFVGLTAAILHLLKAIMNLYMQIFDKTKFEARKDYIERNIKEVEESDWSPLGKDRQISFLKYQQDSYLADLSRVCTSLIQCIPVIGTCYSLYIYNTSSVYISLIPDICCG